MKNISDKKILDGLKKVLVEGEYNKYQNIDIGKVNKNTNLAEELGMDSYERADFVAEVEEKLGVEISFEKVGDLLTVKDYIDYIKNHVR